MLRAVQVSFHSDPRRRDAKTLLREWPALTSVAAAVRRTGIDLHVVRLAGARETVRRDDVEYHFVADSARRRADVTRAVASLKPDVIHVNGFVSSRGIAGLQRRLPQVPVLVQEHGSWVPSGLSRALWKWALRDVTGLMFTAKTQAQPWKDARMVRADLPIFEVLEGSTPFVPGDKLAARNATRMTGDPCLFWSGRLDANKDPFTVLAAFERAATQVPEARLYLCFGEAPLLADVARRIGASPILRQRATLLGTLPHADMELHFRSADFFVQMSHHEGSGFSLLEAMACGVTPLVSDIAAHRAMVGDAGVLIPVGDVDALADAIVAWSSRDRSELRAAARSRFHSALTFEVIAEQLRHAYEAVAKAKEIVVPSPAVVLSEAKDLFVGKPV